MHRPEVDPPPDTEQTGRLAILHSELFYSILGCWKFDFLLLYIRNRTEHYGVGANPAATHAVMHTPSAVLQPAITAGIPAPPVTVPNVNPAAA